jgi:hypothetical protein
MSGAGTIFHKLGRNERPKCEACGLEMWLLGIRPADLGLELRTYECRRCAASKTLLVDPPWRREKSSGIE